MIAHIVMFRLEGEPTTVAYAAESFKNAIEALPGQISELLDARVDIDSAEIDGNWTMALTAHCKDAKDLSVYAAHPAHLECVAIIKPLIAGRACVDAEV